MKFISQIFILAIVVVSLAQDVANDQLEAKAKAEWIPVKPSARAKFVFPKLFDFATYRQLFDKHYADADELARRAKLYIARVCTVFMSALMYKRGLSSKHLKIGPFTDWTDEERGFAKKDSPVKCVNSSSHIASQTPGHTTGDKRQVNLSGESHIGRSKKRTSKKKSLLRFIKEVFGLSHRRGRLEKSSNRRNAMNQDIPFFDFERYWNEFSGEEPDFGPIDLIYLDYRSKNCFPPPKHQGYCGACYAFAAIALVEYHHCMDTGHLVSLSEQYLVDCGRRQAGSLEGCDRGITKDAIDFVQTFGVELEEDYPYRSIEQVCPYDDSIDISEMGFAKITHSTKGAAAKPRKERIRRLLEIRGPLYVDMVTKSDFLDYAGGVDMIHSCDPKLPTKHSMVIVGHGIESGLEYWLMRNSFGIEYGEEGYYKLGKDTDVNCLHYVGFYKGKLNIDEHYEQPLLQQRQD